MQLSKETIKLIQDTLKTAKTLKLDSIAIEPEQIRAVNEARTVTVCEKDIPELEFNGLGIGRVGILASRLAAFDDFTIEATTLPNGIVRQIDIVGNGAKFEYRCANPAAIKAPRNHKFPDTWSFSISEKTLNMLSKACSSVATDNVVIRSNSKGEILLTIEDGTTSDKFTQRFDAEVQNLVEDDGSLDFQFRYNIDMFLLGIKSTKADDEGIIHIIVTEIGAIRTSINNTTVYIIPLADEDDSDD